MVDDHIKDCENEQIKPDKSYKGSLNISLKPELHRKAATIAMLKNISLNKFIQKAIEKAILL